MRLDKEFGEMLNKIADRKDRLLGTEKKLATLGRARLGKEVRGFDLVDSGVLNYYFSSFTRAVRILYRTDKTPSPWYFGFLKHKRDEINFLLALSARPHKKYPYLGALICREAPVTYHEYVTLDDAWDEEVGTVGLNHTMVSRLAQWCLKW